MEKNMETAVSEALPLFRTHKHIDKEVYNATVANIAARNGVEVRAMEIATIEEINRQARIKITHDLEKSRNHSLEEVTKS